MKIKYEPHPVTPARKAELRAQGFKIIDARFKPASVDEPESGSTDINGDGKVSIAEIRAALTAKGIEFDSKAKKPELQALLELAEKVAAIKAQLTEKGIEIPADATLESLQTLLEGAE